MNRLKYENNRLYAELEKCLNLNKLLLKFRICLKSYLKCCKCNQFSDLKTVYNLEKEYQILLKEAQIVSNISQIKNELKDQNLETFVQSFDDNSSSNISEHFFMGFGDSMDGQTTDECQEINGSEMTSNAAVDRTVVEISVKENENIDKIPNLLKTEFSGNDPDILVESVPKVVPIVEAVDSLKPKKRIRRKVERISAKVPKLTSVSDVRSGADYTTDEFEADNQKTVRPKYRPNFVCDDCGLKFECEKQLLIHFEIVHKIVDPNEQKNKIMVCTINETDKEETGDSGQLPEFVCRQENCGLKFPQRSKLVKHMEIDHKIDKPKTFVCEWIGCGQAFSGQQDLTLHERRRHTFEKPFSCHLCDKSYELEKLLRNHLKTHTDKDKYKCEYDGCAFTTPRVYELKGHIKLKHLNHKRYVCNIGDCNRNYKYESDLRQHKKLDHNPLGYQFRFKCDWPGCEMLFKKIDAYKNHMARHKNEKQYKCDFEGCPLTFNLELELRRHRKLHLGTFYNHPCNWPGCTIKTYSPSSLKQHIDSVHLNVKGLQCPDCDKQIATKWSLRQHIKSCRSRKPSPKREITFDYKCDECFRSFKHKNSLVTHKNSVHKLEKLYSCEYIGCGQQFKTSNGLSIHKRSHDNIEQFKCCFPNCDKWFTTRSGLLVHELVHNKKFVCSWPECNRKFAKKCNLESHQRLHQNIRRYKCEVEGCGQTFVNKATLNCHLDRHRDPKPFRCEYKGCDKSFTQKRILVNHITNVHQGKMRGDLQLFNN